MWKIFKIIIFYVISKYSWIKLDLIPNELSFYSLDQTLSEGFEENSVSINDTKNIWPQKHIRDTNFSCFDVPESHYHDSKSEFWLRTVLNLLKRT